MQAATVFGPEAGQIVPQAPQLRASNARMVHVPPQFVWPLEQHLPLEHICPLGQVWPQAPQF